MGEAAVQHMVIMIDQAFNRVDKRTISSYADQGQALVPLFRTLSDDDWDRIREHLRSKGASPDLDVSEALWYPAREAAAQVDGNAEPAVKARALGFVTAIPWPEYGGEGTWDEVASGLLDEFSFVKSQIEAKRPLSLADMSFLSDSGKSYSVSLHSQYRWADECLSGLAPDPFTPLRIHLPSPGRIVTSMTTVVLLTIEDNDVGELASSKLTNSKVVLNPRLFDLYFNDDAEVLPWWRELQIWRDVLEPWKASAALLGADECGEATFHQLRRSLDWNLYESEAAVQLLKQDESQLFSLLHFIELWI